jgi:hypothetical protein
MVVQIGHTSAAIADSIARSGAPSHAANEFRHADWLAV